MFRPEHTMFGFGVHDYPGANGTVHTRVLRTFLNKQFRYVIPSLHDIMAATVAKQLERGARMPGGMFTVILGMHRIEELIKLCLGGKSILAFELASKLVYQVNSRVFIRESLGESLD